MRAGTDVVIVGAGPVGLMLAVELRLAGVDALVLERRAQIAEVAKAGGLGGQILDVLEMRGLLERFETASGLPRPAPRFPFGGLHVDFTQLEDPPMQAVWLPQPQMEGLLEEIASERGAEIRRGHQVVGLTHDDDTVTAEVHGPGGPYRVSASYLVGCDGVGSRIRELAAIEFPGNTYPEVNRLGRFTMPGSITLLDSGDYDVPGLGLVRAGYTQTEGGVFAISSYTSADLGVYTNEDEERSYDDNEPMTVTEFQDSIARVLGAPIPLGEPTRLTRFTYSARNAESYRKGRIFVAGDAAHQFPSGGVAVTAGMLDTVNLAWKLGAAVAGWAPTGLLDSYHDERHLANTRTLLHTQAQVALRRGHDPAAEALRALLSELLVDEQPLRRISAFIAGSDVRYPMPAAHPHALAGTFAPDLTLQTEQGATSVAELLRTARPVLLDLGNRAEIREAAGGWQHRIDIVTAETDHRPADALLIRPDAHIAWAATVDQHEATAAGELQEALSYWFGAQRVASTK